jgi:hypothetical protein
VSSFLFYLTTRIRLPTILDLRLTEIDKKSCSPLKNRKRQKTACRLVSNVAGKKKMEPLTQMGKLTKCGADFDKTKGTMLNRVQREPDTRGLQLRNRSPRASYDFTGCGLSRRTPPRPWCS